MTATLTQPEPFTAESIDLETMFARPRGCVAFRAVGDTLNAALIADGDLVVVERRQTARDGQLVAASVDGGPTKMRRWRRANSGRVRLESLSPSLPDVDAPADAVLVLGVVIGVLRSY